MENKKRLNKKTNKPFLIKIPFINGLGKTKGCELSPDRVVEIIPEIWCNESINPIKNPEEIFNIQEIRTDNDNVMESTEKIFQESKKVFFKRKNEKIAFIGGDHSISFPIAKAFNFCFKNSAFIIFDAHADCMEPMKEPTHEEWLRALIEKEKINPRNILLLGVRNMYDSEILFLKDKKIKYFTTKDLFENKKEILKQIQIFMNRFKNIYLSLDIDIIDPTFAPGTSYGEPCGLTSRETLSLFQKIILNKSFIALDINEVNSKNDSNNQTTKIAAKFLCEIITKKN